MKKIILSLILVMSLSVTAQVKADVDFDVIWENQPDEESDVTGDGFKDLVYSSDTLTETLIVLYCEGFESANLHSKLELYDDTVLKNTIYNTSLSTGLYWLVDIEELSTYDIDNIKVVFYDDYVDIWNIDGQDWASITQLKGVEDPYFVNSIEAMYVLDSTSYNSGFTSGYANALYDYTDEIMVDENDDGYDDDTFEDMYDDIYSSAYSDGFTGANEDNANYNALVELPGGIIGAVLSFALYTATNFGIFGITLLTVLMGFIVVGGAIIVIKLIF